MWQTVYRALWTMAPAAAKYYLNRRAKTDAAYAAHWDERFGRPLPGARTGVLWIHAVSVGETRAAQPLAAELRRRFPDAPLLVTQMTPTGRATAQALFPDAQCRYLPYDKPEYAAQFLREHRPLAGILMETEIWPNLMHACRSNGIPLFLANARLSEKSLRGYQKICGLVAPALAGLSGCFAQSTDDARRLAQLGARRIEVFGNTKYDVEPTAQQQQAAALFRSLTGTRPTVVCGSTRHHQGGDEAEKLLHAWQNYRGNALLVIVPRHPERFGAAYETARRLGFRVQKRSSGTPVAADTQVWIGDSMGELAAYYAAADVAFVGGSLVDSGCQNIIEPIAAGVPTLFGPSTYNFAAACAAALNAGAAIQVADAAGWRTQTERLLRDAAARQDMAGRAAGWIRQHQGASSRTAEAVAAHLAAIRQAV
ncbi:lipid IV(A) 3-deoxy-D-manno-octulosonic acid transferase [Neisseria leonii]|uniref:3-deoxy-D-manno-octulosonic acid transferase n=1 Tax=Neisseria leonii TaxID=2995413 RepID=A0A9X4IE87_9NEIS|nr:lipid IV(A) 3-deoxy-D-manno-octulosonic acid transferase [Neisseria sp. 51.81]MDD9327913.1 lipid IV(A) 3-deoxy-D-manno-octulosonic acid transferase [Neisseria sp. 51.81]